MTCDPASEPSPQERFATEPKGDSNNHFEMLTININSWWTFKQLWTTESAVREMIHSATVVSLQEHHLSRQVELDDAVEFCHKHGFSAVFNAAIELESGKPSGGVAVLVKDRPDIGVTDPQAPTDGQAHRLLAVKVDSLGQAPMLVGAAYLEAGVGLNLLNRQLLAQIVMWQEICQLPVLVGLDANIASTTLLRSEFWSRSPLQVVAPREPTRTNSRSASTIDYMLCSRCLGAQVESVKVLRDIPLAPHSPVRLRRHANAVECVPVLKMPTRLPLVPPFGPTPKPQSWQPLADRVNAAHRWFDDEELDQQARLRTLDEVYQDFAERFEDHLCSVLDAPKRRRSGRAQAPHPETSHCPGSRPTTPQIVVLVDPTLALAAMLDAGCHQLHHGGWRQRLLCDAPA